MQNTEFPVYPGWETVRKIGNGSFGAVYEIQRNLFGTIEKAALKQIAIPQDQGDVDELYSTGYDDASITAHYESYLADIVKEYQLMAEMKGHTNVVYCDDIRYIQKDSGIGWDIYIKMELLTPLMKALDQVSSEEQIVKLGRDMASALVLCRSRNVIHRDIKPQNIFISKDGDFKLGDFGIAKTAEKTSGGTKIGTYNYMAPEVYNNAPYGHAADIYSLGLVLYWLLNNRRLPFYPAPPAVPKASDMEQARMRRFHGEPLPPPARGTAALKQIVLKACAYDPKDRYQSADELLHDLESAAMPARSYPARRSESDEEGTVGAYRLSKPAAPPASVKETVTPPPAADDPGDDSTVGVYRIPKPAAPPASVKETVAPPTVEEKPGEEGTVGVFNRAIPVKAAPQEPEYEGTVGIFTKAEPQPAEQKPVKKESRPEPSRTEEPPKPETPAPEGKKKRGKAGLIIGILVGVLALAVVLLFVLTPGGNNLASEKATTSSSVLAPFYSSANVNDGDLTTYWESITVPASITIDLSNSQSLSKVVIRLNPDKAWTARTQRILVMISNDDINYRQAVEDKDYVFDPALGNTVSISLGSKSARYVKLMINSNSAIDHAQIAEIEIYQ